MLTRLMRHFFKREGGNVALIVTLCMVPMLLSAGAAIDFVRAHLAKTSLQQAIDAAGLAGGANPAAEEEDIIELAQNYLTANATGLVLDVEDTDISTSTVDGVKQVNISATALLETVFMRAVGIKFMEVSIDTSIQRRETGPIHVALVLDTTFSMASLPSTGGSETKLHALRQASTLLVNELMADDKPNVEFAIVPYGGYVRTHWHSELPDPPPDWVRPWSRTGISCVWDGTFIPGCTPTRVDCVIDGVPTPLGCENPACQTPCVNQTRLFTWGGCVGPRNRRPNGTWATDEYLRTIANPSVPPYPGLPSNVSNCPRRRILPLTNDKSRVLTNISLLSLNGETYIPSGLTWGWNVLAAGEPFDTESAASLIDRGGRKVLVLMTDGNNTLRYRNTDGLLVLANDAERDAVNTLTSDLCTNIKQDGITIFTVLFDVQNAATRDMLRDCASGRDKAFNATDGAGLRAAFGAIGNQLKSLRLIQ